ncbi:MAG: D-2-hydroxyacid dehydrogenase [Oscillospiraceae bacterium]|nr:D-2-hydroxyacid dehydrogenase [Oscillospiraceae bacterium]
MQITLIYNQGFKKLSDELIGRVNEIATEAKIIETYHDGVTLEDIVDSEIVFGRIPAQLLKDLPNLKWLHLDTAGADGLTDISLFANKSIIFTRSSGTYGIPIAEHVIGMMTAVSRNFGYYYREQRKGSWSNQSPNFLDIYGSTVLVLGLGDIGTEVCKRLSNFDCNVIGIRHNPSKPHKLVQDIRALSQLHEVLPEVDYVVICTPGTKKTSKLFGEKEFNLMKKNAIIVNIGRGSAIDTDALATALYTQEIYGAGLDVTDPEPLPADHALWSAPNTLITPHISGLTPMMIERRLEVFLDLLKLYLCGEEMYNRIDFTEGY